MTHHEGSDSLSNSLTTESQLNFANFSDTSLSEMRAASRAMSGSPRPEISALTLLEPNQTQSASIDSFIGVMNNSPSRVGEKSGNDAKVALMKLGEATISIIPPRVEPANTGYFNNKEGRYVYTEKGGWVDMVHFMFYAGRALNYKEQGNKNPVGEALQDGYLQEYADSYIAKHSAYSYEDLPSDKFGATFGASVFDPNSSKTLAEQVKAYMVDTLGATEPSRAPNWDQIPARDGMVTKPTWTNKTSQPKTSF